MEEKDLLEKIERMVQEIHDKAGNYTQPVLRRYPLLFTFLVTFGVAAVLYGFELWANKIALFNDHPLVLMLIGVLVLIFTGTLYKTLRKVD